MNNRKKFILSVILAMFFVKTSIAQSAYSDLMHALEYSQLAANAASAGNSDAAASFASQAFQGGSSYSSGHSSGYSGYSYGSTITYGSSGRRSATNMSNVGLKINSSGYNRGAELARYYAEQRAERARRAAERRERMIASYMEPRYAASQERGAKVKAFIDGNSHAKPLSQEAINDIISNGLSGNFIIDDDGDQYFLPENLLEGSGETHEILEDKIKSMSEEEIDKFAEGLYNKLDNGEELSDEEIDFLIARELERKARLEEERKRLENEIRKIEEETARRVEEGINSIFNNN